jgi:hypothetical protein
MTKARKGGRKSRRGGRKSRKGGNVGGILAALKQALPSYLLYQGVKHFQHKKKKGGRKTKRGGRKRRRGGRTRKR